MNNTNTEPIGSFNTQDMAWLGLIREADQHYFLRVANGLLRAGFLTREQILAGMAEVIQIGKASGRQANKFSNLESYAQKQRQEGTPLTLTVEAQAMLAASIEARPKLDVVWNQTQGTADYQLKAKPVHYPIYGAEHIDTGALAQMDVAARLPISLTGALMPDAHVGYGLPIGGVLATEPDKIIPYAVGVDIACRMCLSVFALPGSILKGQRNRLENILRDHTHFGVGTSIRDKFDDSLFDRPEWLDVELAKRLKDKAWKQLGTSGSGNHFVEWGTLTVTAEDALPSVPMGTYVALLSHSGSRGFGAEVAGTYSKIARQKTTLPDEAKNLAWLDRNTQEGQEYWILMNLAGDYASANHHEIHNKAAKALGEKRLALVENHHNFAWLETLPDGREALVHRKGATPAGEGVLGIIPGSMTTPGFLVRGKGDPSSVNSASHGAGRRMSRTQATKTITRHDMMNVVRDAGVQLLGAGVDEAPMVYKDIHTVMAAQHDLVEVLARFDPMIVKMADPGEKAED